MDILYSFTDDETAWVEWRFGDIGGVHYYKFFRYYTMRDNCKIEDERRFNSEDDAAESARWSGFKYVMLD